MEASSAIDAESRNDPEHAGYHENTAINKLFHKQSLHIQLKIYLYQRRGVTRPAI